MGWDIGGISQPLRAYIDQLNDKNLSILIPGAGNAYEVEYLISNGFRNTYFLDFSSKAISNFKSRCPLFPENHIFCQDFFEHNRRYDLILEQTFFCALAPKLREKYVAKMHDLLKQKGKLVGILFNFPLSDSGPPFGGSKDIYEELFDPYFNIEVLENCYNSIKPRSGTELFINMRKKSSK